ncbi:MAG: FAD:protein FMN transferase, partial [Thaumarchaeota archaeon]|nr:FAD:protein FMN transferase [Nitrososphaerota archaeon]
MYVVEGTRSIMGTSVSITVIHPSPEEAKEAANLAFSEMGKIEDLMSVYKEDSEVSILNREG